ncbi:MAG: c-type cytochrome [Alphaproteobacteria bacterium]|nr:c-type cytochrome [Alphaproteobacteria bacterium]
MLSKSQARLFFLTATAGFSLVFLGLTVDSIRQVPARSHADAMTPEVLHGRELWDDHNCMGCHTILGEGAYYAPELTKVVERRGEAWLKTFLRDPEAMFPGQRKMVNYHFTDEEIDAVVAFLGWIGGIDTNGFPAEPDLRAPPPATAVSAVATAGRPEKFGQVCVACHSLGGQGGNVGPALDHVATRYTAEKLDAWLANPQAIKPGTAMPDLKLAGNEREELVRWLMTLH